MARYPRAASTWDLGVGDHEAVNLVICLQQAPRPYLWPETMSLESQLFLLRPLFLLVVCKPVLSLQRLGGSGCKRYFAIQATCIVEELPRLRLQLEVCPTKATSAVGLTQLGSRQDLVDFRKVLYEEPYELRSSISEFRA